ncbi:hypothetical protein WJX84_007585 [Apatococcus fuscideae]|uniref:Uncharacterized protein n=1 Tax=Apatococcus fuscideae TaxID=2026836 RepID=A0AAW1SW93_9CHLO
MAEARRASQDNGVEQSLLALSKLATHLEQASSLPVETSNVSQLLSAVLSHMNQLEPNGSADCYSILQAAQQACSQAFHRLLDMQQQPPAHDIEPEGISTVRIFLQLVHGILCQRKWLQALGSENFRALRNSLCKTLKASIIPLVELAFAAHGQQTQQSAALTAALQSLWAIARSSACALREGPDELRSYPLLNCTWVTCMKMLTSEPEKMCSLVLQTDESKQSLLSCLLDSIQQEYSLCRSDPSDQHIQVMKFWLQHLHRLASALPHVALQNWEVFLQRASSWLQDIHQLCCNGHDIANDIHVKLQSLLATRLSIVCNLSMSAAGDHELQALFSLLDGQQPPELLLVAEMLARPGLISGAKFKQMAAEQLLPKLFAQAQEALHDFPAGLQCSCITRVHSAAVAFLANCCSAGCGWQEGQVALFKLALNPDPLVQQLLSFAWGGILRRSDDSLARAHLSALYSVLCGVLRLEAAQDAYERPSATVEQLAALLAGLCLSASSIPRRCLQQIFWQVASSPATASPADPALAAISCRLLRLSQGRQADRQDMQRRADLLQETLLQATAHPASPQLLQILVKAEELVLCLQAASPHKMVDMPMTMNSLLECLASLGDHTQRDACQAQALKIILRLLASTDDNTWLSPVLPIIQEHQLWNTKATTTVASLLGVCAGIEPRPQAIFHATLTVPTWPVKHAAMQGFLHFMRAPGSTSFQTMLPPALYDQQQQQQQQALGMLEQGLQILEEVLANGGGENLRFDGCSGLAQKEADMQCLLASLMGRLQAVQTQIGHT